MANVPPFSDVQKERRNVMVVSVAILLFMFATDGNINKLKSISLLGSEQFITKPLVLFGFAWIYLAYSFARYYLYTASARKQYLNSILEAVAEDKKFKIYLCSFFSEVPDLKVEQVGIMLNELKRKWFKREGIIVCGTTNRKGVKLSYKLFKLLELKYYIVKSFTNRDALHGYHHLTDYLLPNLLFAFAILWGINKYFWPK
jgi:hypothetical protein